MSCVFQSDNASAIAINILRSESWKVVDIRNDRIYGWEKSYTKLNDNDKNTLLTLYYNH